jgi:hypothetical protein
MKSDHKIYLFFIILALLFWNPISYFIFYANTPIFSKLSIKMGYWVIFLSGILLFFLIKKNKLNLTIKNLVFALTFTGIIFATLVTIDRVVGYDLKKEVSQVQKQVGIIFEPNSKARYQTIEFDFDLNTNSLGLRDREINIDKDDKYRILAFGNAWTSGWGVNIENSWPKKLEQYLIAKNMRKKLYLF